MLTIKCKRSILSESFNDIGELIIENVVPSYQISKEFIELKHICKEKYKFIEPTKTTLSKFVSKVREKLSSKKESKVIIATPIILNREIISLVDHLTTYYNSVIIAHGLLNENYFIICSEINEKEVEETCITNFLEINRLSVAVNAQISLLNTMFTQKTLDIFLNEYLKSLS